MEWNVPAGRSWRSVRARWRSRAWPGMRACGCWSSIHTATWQSHSRPSCTGRSGQTDHPDLHTHAHTHAHTHTHTHTHMHTARVAFLSKNTQRFWSRVLVSPSGDRLWQTLTYIRNPNVEPSSYPYTSTEWFSDMPTNFGWLQVTCPKGHLSEM